jgi:hypothetical protein
MTKERNPRDVDVHEIVDVIETLADWVEAEGDWTAGPAREMADKIVAKLVGPERASESRLSSRHIVADMRYCAKVADSLAISIEEANAFFIGEPIKRVEAVAAWALDAADKNFIGLDKHWRPDPESPGVMVHGQRGRAVADMLRDWARVNHTGVYRQAQLRPQATPTTSLQIGA